MDARQVLKEKWTVEDSGQRRFTGCFDVERAPEILLSQERHRGAKRKRTGEASHLEDVAFENRSVLQARREPSERTLGMAYWYDSEVEVHNGEPKVAGPRELNSQRQTEATNTQTNARAQTNRF